MQYMRPVKEALVNPGPHSRYIKKIPAICPALGREIKNDNFLSPVRENFDVPFKVFAVQEPVNMLPEKSGVSFAGSKKAPLFLGEFVPLGVLGKWHSYVHYPPAQNPGLKTKSVSFFN